MAVEIAHDPVQQIAIMWDNTTDTAFGPVFSGPSANTELVEFLMWLADNGTLGGDPRKYHPPALESYVKVWCDLPTVTP